MVLSALRHSARVARVSNVRMASCARDIPADRQADLLAKVEEFKSHVTKVRVARETQTRASFGLWGGGERVAAARGRGRLATAAWHMPQYCE